MVLNGLHLAADGYSVAVDILCEMPCKTVNIIEHRKHIPEIGVLYRYILDLRGKRHARGRNDTKLVRPEIVLQHAVEGRDEVRYVEPERRYVLVDDYRAKLNLGKLDEEVPLQLGLHRRDEHQVKNGFLCRGVFCRLRGLGVQYELLTVVNQLPLLAFKIGRDAAVNLDLRGYGAAAHFLKRNGRLAQRRIGRKIDFCNAPDHLSMQLN